MSAFNEISEKFIKVLEENIPALKGRIVIAGQQWQEFKDGKTYVILSLLDSEVMNFSEGKDESEWSRNFKIALDVYGRDINDPLYIAEMLAFCCDRVPMINRFLENNIGVFCTRKIKNLSGIEGALPEQRFNLEFTLKFIGKSKGSFEWIEKDGRKTLTAEA